MSRLIPVAWRFALLLLGLLAGGVRPAAAEGVELAEPVLAAPTIEAEPLAAPEPGHSAAVEVEVPAGACEVWFISSRGAGCPGPDGVVPLHVWQRGADCQWIESDVLEFLARQEPSMPTCFYIHGNRISYGESRSNGLRVHASLSAQACGPFRFVIWSWPADIIKGVVEDAKVKAHRSDLEAYPLAWLIDQIDPAVPVSLLGYSYGARVATGALHTLGGGEVCGRGLDYRLHPQRALMRGVLMAAALDNCWLAPGNRHGLALTQVDHLLVMVNPADKVLERYGVIYSRRNGPLALVGSKKGPQALGLTGAAGNLGPYRDRVDHLNVTGWVGSTHDWERYMGAPSLVARMIPYLMFAGE
jgi:hypothetical protein